MLLTTCVPYDCGDLAWWNCAILCSVAWGGKIFHADNNPIYCHTWNIVAITLGFDKFPSLFWILSHTEEGHCFPNNWIFCPVFHLEVVNLPCQSCIWFCYDPFVHISCKPYLDTIGICVQHYSQNPDKCHIYFLFLLPFWNLTQSTKIWIK